ncbi:TD and POZ domain-containing protein 5-like [Venturia canescens]|uniref:TD and POZ domain-containing protein 5-like n=1 Tax=Venturia canescens TaxID=32260 RepID=UPI001C9C93C9|nr:TD and POZ domain-containing protein 5-like [Venturia canescens]
MEPPPQSVAYSKGSATPNSLTVSAQVHHITDFAWTLTDWVNLCNTTYAQGVRSKLFRVDGIDNCTCQISIFPKNSTKSFCIEFSDSLDVLGMRMTIHLNNYHYECIQSYPVPSSIILSGSSHFKKVSGYNDYYNHQNTTLDYILKNGVLSLSASIKVKFEVSIFPHIHNFQKHKTNVTNLQTMFDNKIFCDVTFVFEDCELPAHKSILAVHSKVFEAMFTNEMSEKDTGRVEVLDISAEIFKAFLKYLYTREIDLKRNVTEILVVADKYEVCELKDLCEKYMLANLSELIVVEYLLIADKLCCTALKKKSLTMLQNNAILLCNVIRNESYETFMSLKKIFFEDFSKNFTIQLRNNLHQLSLK